MASPRGQRRALRRRPPRRRHPRRLHLRRRPQHLRGPRRLRHHHRPLRLRGPRRLRRRLPRLQHRVRLRRHRLLLRLRRHVRHRHRHLRRLHLRARPRRLPRLRRLYARHPRRLRLQRQRPQHMPTAAISGSFSPPCQSLRNDRSHAQTAATTIPAERVKCHLRRWLQQQRSSGRDQPVTSSSVSTPRRSSPRATISRWISLVPSQMRSTRSSRRNRSAVFVRM